MKTNLALIVLAVLGLSACSGQESASEATVGSASANVASDSSAGSTPVAVEKVDPASVPADCSVTVESSDQMKYSVNEIAVKKSCEAFKVTLKHTGTMPVAQMGHNIVISKADDASAIASEGTGAGPDSGYLNIENPAIVAHTDMIGGGQETTVAFKTNALDPKSSYKFFCTFPAHFGTMQGDVKLVD